MNPSSDITFISAPIVNALDIKGQDVPIRMNPDFFLLGLAPARIVVVRRGSENEQEDNTGRKWRHFFRNLDWAKTEKRGGRKRHRGKNGKNRATFGSYFAFRDGEV